MPFMVKKSKKYSPYMTIFYINYYNFFFVIRKYTRQSVFFLTFCYLYILSLCVLPCAHLYMIIGHVWWTGLMMNSFIIIIMMITLYHLIKYTVPEKKRKKKYRHQYAIPLYLKHHRQYFIQWICTIHLLGFFIFFLMTLFNNCLNPLSLLWFPVSNL